MIQEIVALEFRQMFYVFFSIFFSRSFARCFARKSSLSYRLSTHHVVILKTTFFRVCLFGGEHGVFLIRDSNVRGTRKQRRKTVALERPSQKFSDIAVIAPVTVLK